MLKINSVEDFEKIKKYLSIMNQINDEFQNFIEILFFFYNYFIDSEQERITVLCFTADWAQQCQQLLDAFNDLEKLLSPEKIQFASISAEDFQEISLKYNVIEFIHQIETIRRDFNIKFIIFQISAVPTTIFISKGESVDRVDGIDVAAVTEKCRHLADTSNNSRVKPTGYVSLEDRLTALINRAPLMIFMKGSRNAPRCGFSKQMIAIIEETG